MAHERSIPKPLEDAVVRRWITGQSPEAIADWIIATNRRRKTPVHTSRSSIERLLAEQMARDYTIPQLRVVLELRRDAVQLLVRLQQIREEYRRIGEETPHYETETEARLDRASSARRMQALSREELCLARMLRMAGVGGAAAERLLLSREMDGLREDLETDSVAGTLVDEQLAAVGYPVPPSEAEKSVRLDDGSTGGTSESVTEPVSRPPAVPPLPEEVPHITDPEWTLTPEQREEWEQTKAVIHGFLLAIWGWNGNAVPKGRPLTEPLPPVPGDRAALRIAELVPALTLPAWPLTKEQKHHLEHQMKRVNGWIHWLRLALHERVAGRGNWRKDLRDGWGRFDPEGFVEA